MAAWMVASNSSALISTPWRVLLLLKIRSLIRCKSLSNFEGSFVIAVKFQDFAFVYSPEAIAISE